MSARKRIASSTAGPYSPSFSVRSGDMGDTCGGTQLTTVQAGANLRVQRIRYWKNCATVNIVLPDGREGYIVLGDGEVLVKPPLR